MYKVDWIIYIKYRFILVIPDFLVIIGSLWVNKDEQMILTEFR